MNELVFKMWIGFGAICVVAEFLIPGLVVVFIGLASLTVALGIYLGLIESLTSQFITFFISSIIYVFTLRIILLNFIPSDSEKKNINEDENVIGEIAIVTEKILAGKNGRISHSDSTWQAKSNTQEEILVGQNVKIIGRDNITWIVEIIVEKK